eukprot:gene27223-biopygen7504
MDTRSSKGACQQGGGYEGCERVEGDRLLMGWDSPEWLLSKFNIEEHRNNGKASCHDAFPLFLCSSILNLPGGHVVPWVTGHCLHVSISLQQCSFSHAVRRVEIHSGERIMLMISQPLTPQI